MDLQAFAWPVSRFVSVEVEALPDGFDRHFAASAAQEAGVESSMTEKPNHDWVLSRWERLWD